MNDERLEAILIQALAALEAGETVGQVLTRYPAEAEQLEPMLRAAVRLMAYGRETLRTVPTMQVSARNVFLARAAAMAPRAAPALQRAGFVYKRMLLSFLAVVVLIFVISGSALGASAARLPGDPLYGVKRSLESLQLSLTMDSTQRVNLEETYSQRRLEEIKAVRASRRTVSVEFAGQVDSINAAVWTIDGIAVQVSASTMIEGALHVGDLAEVTGHTLPDGQIVAERIEAEGIRLAGVVEAMGAQSWVVGSQRVLVTRDTRITGAPRIGAQVEVHARRFLDGTLLALKIEFDDHDSPLSGQLTPRPSPGSTALPASSTVRVQPTATMTPGPSRGDAPTETPRARSSSAPTAQATSRPPETGEPGETPEPTKALRPSRTPEPPRTPKPARTPAPARTRQPGWTPEPTELPEPSRAPEPIEARTP